MFYLPLHFLMNSANVLTCPPHILHVKTTRDRSFSPPLRAGRGFPGAQRTRRISPHRGAASSRRAPALRSQAARRAVTVTPISAASPRAPRVSLCSRRICAWTCPIPSWPTSTTPSCGAFSAVSSSVRSSERTSGCAPLPTPRRPLSRRRAKRLLAAGHVAEERAEGKAQVQLGRARARASRSAAEQRKDFRGSRRCSVGRAQRSACASRSASTRSTLICRRERERSRSVPRSSPAPSGSPSLSVSLGSRPEARWGVF